ncbi:hypothetical protein SAMN02745824_2721 [Parasphingorhabdus marina DSM 22363]|uniref:Holin n=1 Tax=Parasphingorhabdus marina DSM 22363 TaxID=1123272 RepID=A0A1N6G8H0_9SPHN|nr:hypothetical protein [Parasphingorhabdus marina]SIO03807.1 hypothetical protein SAMN02745824_2721 [Parasphingorhabdus marina DSM 22363]
MKKLLTSLNNYFKYTRKEYEASINALNIFFGAVIGISLGGIGDIPTLDYVLLLVVTATAVTSILFVTYSERQYWSILLVGLVLFAMWSMNNGDDRVMELPPKLLPTLAVWAAMAISTEFSSITGEKKSDES